MRAGRLRLGMERAGARLEDLLADQWTFALWQSADAVPLKTESNEIEITVCKTTKTGKSTSEVRRGIAIEVGKPFLPRNSVVYGLCLAIVV